MLRQLTAAHPSPTDLFLIFDVFKLYVRVGYLISLPRGVWMVVCFLSPLHWQQCHRVIWCICGLKKSYFLDLESVAVVIWNWLQKRYIGSQIPCIKFKNVFKSAQWYVLTPFQGPDIETKKVAKRANWTATTTSWGRKRLRPMPAFCYFSSAERKKVDIICTFTMSIMACGLSYKLTQVVNCSSTRYWRVSCS